MNLDGGELFFAVVAWVHAIAATAWVGGSIVFALVLRPVSRIEPEAMKRVIGPISAVYREIVDIAVIAILISGILLTLDRLTSQRADAVYVSVLAVKVALALVMFYLVWVLRKSPPGPGPKRGIAGRLSWLLGYNAIVAVGLVVFFLADVLTAIFQANLRAP